MIHTQKHEQVRTHLQLVVIALQQLQVMISADHAGSLEVYPLTALSTHFLLLQVSRQAAHQI